MRPPGYTVQCIQAVADLHRAVSESTRVRILNVLLHRGELCVCDVESILGTTQSTASRHLNHLKKAGLVADQRRGTWVYYRVAPKLPSIARSALRELKRALEEDPEAQRDLKRAAAVERAAGCRPIELSRSKS